VTTELSQSDASTFANDGALRLRAAQIPERGLKSVVEKCGTAVCLAEAGDIWLYATPIVHASDAARRPAHRRVLQVDFAAADLPGGLTWLGV